MSESLLLQVKEILSAYCTKQSSTPAVFTGSAENFVATGARTSTASVVQSVLAN